LGKISEILAGADIFSTPIFVTFLHGRPVQCGRESTHKSQAQGDHASLDIYINANQHLFKEKYETISGA
jgi:hypothetical protein